MRSLFASVKSELTDRDLRELRRRLNLGHDIILSELLDNLGAVRILEVELLLVRLGGGERVRLEGVDGAGLVDVVLEEVGGGLLHREGHLRVGDAEDAVPGEEKLSLLLAKSAGGDEDELLELAAGLEVGVLVAELDALAEEAAANLDVRVGGVGILEAELLAEVAERLGLPALHGIVAHGDDALEVGVVELGDRLGAVLGHILHAKLGSDGVHVRLGDGRGIAVQHAVPERLGRGGDTLLVRGSDGDGGAGAEAAVSTALAALEPVAVPAAAPTARAPPTTTP